MAFYVPDQCCNLFDEVNQRFRLLIQKRVVTGIDEIRLDAWLANFTTTEDKYLAARILDKLVFRSNAMICSSIDHLLQCALPSELRRWDLFPYTSLEEFLDSLAKGVSENAIRFVAVEGSTVNEEPGKSGAVIIRLFRQRANIDKSLTCRPELIPRLPDSVKCLVFVDDVVGTGMQFIKFAKIHKLGEFTNKKMLYFPLVAFRDGVAKIEKSFPWLSVIPIELLDMQHQFYCGKQNAPEIWATDGENTVRDLTIHVEQLCKSRGLPTKTKHGLDLLLGFEHATPNNTLLPLWASSSDWAPLLIR